MKKLFIVVPLALCASVAMADELQAKVEDMMLKSFQANGIATLERQKTILRTEIDQLREQHQTEQAQIRANVRNRQKTENALEEAKRSLNRVLAERQEAQKVIDRAARIRHLDSLKRGEVPSPWDDTHQNNGPEFG